MVGRSPANCSGVTVQNAFMNTHTSRCCTIQRRHKTGLSHKNSSTTPPSPPRTLLSTRTRAKPPQEEGQNKESCDVDRSTVFSAAQLHKPFIIYNSSKIITMLIYRQMSWDNSFSIETGYGLDGRGSIPSRGWIFLFSTASRPILGPHSLLIKG
jgi:hypothetical protein